MRPIRARMGRAGSGWRSPLFTAAGQGGEESGQPVSTSYTYTLSLSSLTLLSFIHADRASTHTHTHTHTHARRLT